MTLRRILGRRDNVEITLDLPPTDVDTTDGDTVYMRWTGGTEIETVARVQKTAAVWNTSRARGLWADRATLVYTSIELGG